MFGVIMAILANLTFVVSNAMFRKTEKSTSPPFINMFRTGIGMFTFIIISVIFGIFSLIFLLPWTLWLVLIVSFIFGQVIGDTSYFMAQKDLGTTKALAVSMTFPFFTFILDVIFLRRIFNIILIPSAILISIGVLLISKFKVKTYPQDSQEVNQNRIKQKEEIEIRSSSTKNLKPALYGLIASIGWSISVVLIDYGSNQINLILSTGSISSIIANVIRFPFAFLILLFLTKFSNRSNYEIKTRNTWIWLIIASIIGTSLGVYFFTEAARIAGASVLALISSANPLFSLPVSYGLNREKLTSKGFIGVILTIIGVILILL
ncbi:MAG: DMT family transporter [Candidatus Lokiarchaeota archaeon]